MKYRVIATVFLLVVVMTLFSGIHLYLPVYAQNLIITNNIQSVNGKDIDKDGIADTVDNCPTVSNPEQKDTNADGYGDKCVPPSTKISEDATIGLGFVSGERCVLGHTISVGEKVKIGSDVTIGSGVSIRNNVVIGNRTTIEKRAIISSNVSIDINCSIGENAIIGENVKIGKNVIIEKNAIVIRNTKVFNDTIIREDSTYRGETITP